MDCSLTILKLGKAWPFERAIRVECARNGAEALEKIRNSRFLLAVLDWNMPPLDGGDVLRTMRENGLRTPVVIVSGRHREDIAVDLQSLAATYVNKNELDPVSFRGAITASIQLQARSSGLESGLDTTRVKWTGLEEQGSYFATQAKRRGLTHGSPDTFSEIHEISDGVNTP